MVVLDGTGLRQGLTTVCWERTSCGGAAEPPGAGGWVRTRLPANGNVSYCVLLAWPCTVLVLPNGPQYNHAGQDRPLVRPLCLLMPAPLVAPSFYAPPDLSLGCPRLFHVTMRPHSPSAPMTRPPRPPPALRVLVPSVIRSYPSLFAFEARMFVYIHALRMSCMSMCAQGSPPCSSSCLHIACDVIVFGPALTTWRAGSPSGATAICPP